MNKNLEEMILYLEEREKKNKKKIIFPSSLDKHILVIYDREKKIKTGIFLHDRSSIRIKDVIEAYNFLKKSFNCESFYSIFYKDGENFFRRLIDKKPSAYSIGSFRRYRQNNSIQRINILRSLEKLPLFNYNIEFMRNFSNPSELKNQYLIYYQPQTKKLKQGLRLFRPSPIYLDYSYLKYRKDEDLKKLSHAKSRYSKDYFKFDDFGYF